MTQEATSRTRESRKRKIKAENNQSLSHGDSAQNDPMRDATQNGSTPFLLGISIKERIEIFHLTGRVVWPNIISYLLRSSVNPVTTTKPQRFDATQFFVTSDTLPLLSRTSDSSRYQPTNFPSKIYSKFDGSPTLINEPSTGSLPLLQRLLLGYATFTRLEQVASEASATIEIDKRWSAKKD
ncbi:hypothetical protein C8R44DRAFT_725533 [Mycena epipterygia]|nr:hypothetical protein C8R44DRAFT_725533 [Mycena epipterygia]